MNLCRALTQLDDVLCAGVGSFLDLHLKLCGGLPCLPRHLADLVKLILVHLLDLGKEIGRC